ncbi:hypothetical protein [Peribacillus muralis]|nr:hypothetical protein [Peribacillus muralis]
MRAIEGCLNGWIAIVLETVEKNGQVLEVGGAIMENNNNIAYINYQS